VTPERLIAEWHDAAEEIGRCANIDLLSERDLGTTRFAGSHDALPS